jgi:hypothetical protein
LDTISNPSWDGEYVVNWNDVTGTESYELQEDDNPGFASPTVLYEGADSQFLVMDQEGGTWHYRVRASNAGGSSVWSNSEATGVVPAAPVLAPVNNPTRVGEYLVDWAEVTNATSYRLEEDDNPDFSSPTVLYSGAGTQYYVSGQGTGLWYYRVRASNEYGPGPWSSTEQAGVVAAAPAFLPSNNTNGARDYPIDWSEVTGATSYELQEDDNSSFASAVTVYTGSSTEFGVTGQPLGTWHYRVRAHNEAGYSLWSDPQSVEVLWEWSIRLPLVIRGSDGSP